MGETEKKFDINCNFLIDTANKSLNERKREIKIDPLYKKNIDISLKDWLNASIEEDKKGSNPLLKFHIKFHLNITKKDYIQIKNHTERKGLEQSDQNEVKIAYLSSVFKAAKEAKIDEKQIIIAAQEADLDPEQIKIAARNANIDEGQIAEAEALNLIASVSPNLILQGPPGTGKTYCAKQIARYILKIWKQDLQDSEYFKLVQFHPSTCYEDFVRGIKAVTSDGTVSYRAENGVLGALCDQALKKPEKTFVLIIDEINRANLPAVLGECIYALEYRGEPVDTPYAVAAPKDDSKELRKPKQFIIPENLTIIGTMNTADRSAGYIDYAIRRRFAFIPVLPDVSVIKDDDAAKGAFGKVQSLFGEHLSPDFHKDDVAIGHSYFLQTGDAHTASMQYAVAPLLEEYLKDGIFKEASRVQVDKVIEELKNSATE
jgi:5-methylcytosine-specific restriction endonuclease McrBC GTP-binding regulatory subunit McrB